MESTTAQWFEKLSQYVPPHIYAPVIAVTLVIVLWFLKSLIFRKLHHISSKTKIQWDDVLIHAISLPLYKVVLISVLFFSCVTPVWGQDDPAQPQSDLVSKSESAVQSKKDEIKKIDEITAKTKQVLEEKEKVATEATREAEKAIQEKEVIEKEAVLSEQVAKIAKQEAEILKQLAEVRKDPDAAKKAKEVEKEAEKLTQEAEAKKALLTIAEQKALMAQQAIDFNKITIDNLQKELHGLRSERAFHRPWVEKTITAAIIAGVGLFFFFILGSVTRRFNSIITKKEAHKGGVIESEAALQMKTMSKLCNWLGGVIIFFAVVYLILDNFGMNVGPLIAGAGVMGLALGFGGQYLIRDLINGLFILLEGQFHVNDVIKVGDVAGLVEDINLRITTLRDLEGRVIIIPNGEIKTVINFTKDYSQALFDIGVAYKENVDKVMQVIKDTADDMRKDKYFKRVILADIEMFGVDQFADSAVIIKFRIRTLPIKQWEVKREFNRRLKNKFDELGIEIPFPHRTLYLGTGEDNAWVKETLQK